MGDHKGRPYTRTARRRGPRTTLAVAHPATNAPGGRAVAHLESSTASFHSYEVASHALAASRTTRTRPSGNRHGRRQASPLRPELGDEARVGATLAVAHPATLSRPEGARPPISNPARLRFIRTRWRPTPLRRPVPTRTRPSGKPAWATTRVAPTPRTRRRGPRRGDPRGRPSRDPIAPAGRAVAHLDQHLRTRSATTRTRPSGKPAWATGRPYAPNSATRPA